MDEQARLAVLGARADEAAVILAVAAREAGAKVELSRAQLRALMTIYA